MVLPLLLGVVILVAFAASFVTVGRQEHDPTAASLEPDIAGKPTAQVLTSAGRGFMTPGVEGSLLFVRLVAPDGEVVMDTQFAWPADSRTVPAGSYRVAAYFRVCTGNCGNLSEGELPLCDVEVDLAPGGSLELLIRSTPGNFGLGCGMRAS